MMTPSFHRLAAKELRAARAWYASRDPDVAMRFMQSVHAATVRLCDAPEDHPVELKQIRWVKVRRFPYRLIFETAGPDRVLILAVAHSSRRSRYWRRRQ
jgi:toxin ParE1/3/4